MIKSAEVSVVVQGPILKDPITHENWTKASLESVREKLPDSEIILSTWKDEDISGLDYDILLLNEDPGAIDLKWDDLRLTLNTNRQLVSTRNGILAASRKFVLKLRSESIVNSTNFLEYFGVFRKRADEWNILDERVLVNSAVDSHMTKRPFYVSDCYYFGLKTDLLKMWDIPLATSEVLGHNTVGVGSMRIKSKRQMKEKGLLLERSGNEQYYWSAFLNKSVQGGLVENYNENDTLIEISDKTIANNLVILGYDEYGITSKKYPYNKEVYESITYCGWQRLYKKYCDEDFCIDQKKTIYANDLLRSIMYAGADFTREYFPRMFITIKKICKTFHISINRE